MCERVSISVFDCELIQNVYVERTATAKLNCVLLRNKKGGWAEVIFSSPQEKTLDDDNNKDTFRQQSWQMYFKYN